MTDKPEFQREDRYIVIKRSDLKKVPVAYRSTMITPMFNLLPHLPRREYVVIESDWPEYEPVWQMLEARVTGAEPVPPAGVEPVIYALSYYNDVGGYSPKMVPRDSLPEPETREGYVLECDHRAHVTRLQAEAGRLNSKIDTMRNKNNKLNDTVAILQPELTKALDRVYELEHAIFHALDDSGEDATTGEITIYKLDFDKLSALIPEDWEHRSEADKTTRVQRVEQLNQEIATLLAQDDHEQDS